MYHTVPSFNDTHPEKNVSKTLWKKEKMLLTCFFFFSHFPTVFSTLSMTNFNFFFLVTFIVWAASNQTSMKFCYFAKNFFKRRKKHYVIVSTFCIDLTLYKTTNFRLVQTESICRRRFKFH